MEVTGRRKKKKRILMIDDCRTMPADVIARNYAEGVWELEHHGPWDELLLDFDLGDESYCPETGRIMAGYDVVAWLEDHLRYKPTKITVISEHRCGREQLENMIEGLYTE